MLGIDFRDARAVSLDKDALLTIDMWEVFCNESISAAEIMKRLAEEGAVEKIAPIAVGDVTVRQLSSSCVEISTGDKSAIMTKDNIDGSRLANMGISDKDVKIISDSIAKTGGC